MLPYPGKVILILSDDPSTIIHVYTRAKRNAVLDLYIHVLKINTNMTIYGHTYPSIASASFKITGFTGVYAPWASRVRGYITLIGLRKCCHKITLYNS